MEVGALVESVARPRSSQRLGTREIIKRVSNRLGGREWREEKERRGCERMLGVFTLGSRRSMALRKYVPPCSGPSANMKPLSFSGKVQEKAELDDLEPIPSEEIDVDIDLREVYFLIMHFLSAGPCHRTFGQFWNELLEHQLLPRRYHAWYSKSGVHSGDENDDGTSFPLSYNKLVERYPHIEKDHLVKLLKQLMLCAAPPSNNIGRGCAPSAANVPTLLGKGSFSLLGHDRNRGEEKIKSPPIYMRWPHKQADQVRGLGLREIGGGFTRHHRAPSTRAACYAIAKPSTMVQKMQNIKKIRGHRNAVYCAIFDRSGRYVITGSDDRLVKIWSMETAYCLSSCRGHEGDITDLAVSSNNFAVASASNDCIIRVWRLPDGLPISVLRGHTGAVTAIAFSPRPGSVFQLLSSSDDGTCRIWDARNSNISPRIYVPRPTESVAGRNQSASTSAQSHQIFCCAFNANGTVFVTGSSDTLARVWSAFKSNADEYEQPNHEMDVLAGHENDVNYVQFSGCAVASRFSSGDQPKEENVPKFKNSWFTKDNIVTCSRDGSAIIWIPRSRRSHGKVGRWTRAYHLKVPPPPMPPQPPRGGPRQRILPTPRGVNMIVWSLDNRFVLAAIMDCRICVWNAVDGSLVHSLTGHSESTYVLDVHPFNPRIAMSAGYDGKTIVWDIWEGTPIRIYEMGRFKLVDGKFSSDGTSIILSDEVGQLYILSTGQGESQKDAKYDQFFLGDYRPLMQDTHGNVLDQETQLPPYRRNMQDLLCDSSMIPYPEPYQTTFQQRRLGALGVEWRPLSVRLAVGPEINLDQDFQMLPPLDLDAWIDPLPEFVDAIEWEPEVEVMSNDTDSEYNEMEEYSSGGEQGSLGSYCSGALGCSEQDSDAESTHTDSLRRSKRKKQKPENEITTTSGRRVKRRNLDVGDDDTSGINKSRKPRNGQKPSKRKSFKSKSLRPQRAAARNALTLFSRIKSTDGEDEDGSEGDSSESESTLQDSIAESDESDQSSQNAQRKHTKGKEVSIEQTAAIVEPKGQVEFHTNAGNRKKLVLKLPIRNPNKLVNENPVPSNHEADIVASSSRAPLEAADESKNYLGYQDPGYSSEDAKSCRIGRRDNAGHEKVDDLLDLSEGYKDSKIKWGGVRARTSKRLRLGEASSTPGNAGYSASFDDRDRFKGISNGGIHTEKEMETTHSHSDLPQYEYKMDRLAHSSDQCNRADTIEGLDISQPVKISIQLNECRESENPPEQAKQALEDKGETKALDINASKLKENPLPMPLKLKIRSKSFPHDSGTPSEVKVNPLEDEDLTCGGCDTLLESCSAVEHNPSSTFSELDGNNQMNSNYENQDELRKEEESTSVQGLQDLHSHPNCKMYDAVYRRSKSSRVRTTFDGKDNGTSNASNHHVDAAREFSEAPPVEEHRTRSKGLKESTEDPSEGTSNAKDLHVDVRMDLSEVPSTSAHRTRSKGLKVIGQYPDVSTSDMNSIEGHGLEDASETEQKPPTNRHDQHLSEEWRSSSRLSVGLRSTRNRRGSHFVRNTSPIDRRKPHQTAKKLSWLMLSMHEDGGSRYIPQKGDEVVYLKQGHQEYLNFIRAAGAAPWTLKAETRAVDFCKVQDLEYATHPGSGESCCKMTLKFVDPASPSYDKTFKLTLPEVTSFPDFLVERTRYDASIKRNWTHRDKCRVWWKNEDEENGSWWEGRIMAVNPKSPEFPDSPWERYVIQYKTDPTEKHRHSPWELYDFDNDGQVDQPHIDDDIRDKLLASLAKLEESGDKVQDTYGIQKLKQVAQKSNFFNRFPVPLSLEVIQSRLAHDYYRSIEALEHDIAVMLSNAESYFGRRLELSAKMERLSKWFRRTLSSL
ncbi:WD40 repeat [Dillenia turbinata]|uniref:WD40 repeat n=1 Tax=Dillenia turbinata TaxID=194707 RepID=A0AAN8UNA0_9MAGN